MVKYHIITAELHEKTSGLMCCLNRTKLQLRLAVLVHLKQNVSFGSKYIP